MTDNGYEHKMSRIAYNEDLKAQVDCLEQILQQNKVIQKILKLAPKFQMPNWYLGAGSIAQTIWNELHGFDLNYGIKDYDLVYYDSNNLSDEKEELYIQKGKELFKDIPVEIKNEARVHLWYKKRFGYPIRPYQSIEDAINTWPTTATCIAVKYNDKSQFIIYAPYGLNDLLGMIVRPNKTQITKETYLRKVERWKTIWHKLKIIPWSE